MVTTDTETTAVMVTWIWVRPVQRTCFGIIRLKIPVSSSSNGTYLHASSSYSLSLQLYSYLSGTSTSAYINAPSINTSPSPSHAARGGTKDRTPVPFYPRVLRAALYGAQVFVSFFLMLVFMTYNAYLIFAVVLGASIGHFVFDAGMDIEAVLAGRGSDKGMACH
ncbi:Ctr copper transporter family-domain-containing protein [Multifurca ochricompacta]|uniref:Copper transport protein n=1 Tax=Multifurca ochricompacta TaxID=376703 RepID=A0AAD4M8E5_9AGAM|nr:Ctr copper transporter family-domain-containing protein [Multifurca ochricompacta]